MTHGKDKARSLSKYIEDNQEDLDDRDIQMLRHCASLLAAGPKKMLALAYKQGYLDGTECKVTSNKHIWAKQLSEAYAENMLIAATQR